MEGTCWTVPADEALRRVYDRTGELGGWQAKKEFWGFLGSPSPAYAQPNLKSPRKRLIHVTFCSSGHVQIRPSATSAMPYQTIYQ